MIQGSAGAIGMMETEFFDGVIPAFEEYCCRPDLSGFVVKTELN